MLYLMLHGIHESCGQEALTIFSSSPRMYCNSNCCPTCFLNSVCMFIFVIGTAATAIRSSPSCSSEEAMVFSPTDNTFAG